MALRNRVVASALAVVTAGVICAATATPSRAGAIAFAKESTDLGSSDSQWYYAADPTDLGPFDTPAGLVPDNGLTSAAAATPCPADHSVVCVVPALVPDSQGEAIASADLAGGTLRVYAFADGRIFNGAIFVPLVQSEAYAGFRDTINVTSDGVLHFGLHIDGTDTYDPRDGGTNDYINFLINGAPAQTRDGQGLASNDGVTGFGCGGGDSSLTLCSVDLIVDVPVTSGDAVDFSLLLGVVAQDGTADYSHTLTLSATGVSFTSQSGVFLTDTSGPASVPEPPTIAIFVSAALGLLLFAGRRQAA